MDNLLKKRFHLLSLFTASLVLIVVKIPALNLPHYWDEAFPYSYAIGYMTENGPGILSDAAPAEYTRGHPLLYHFLQACWNLLAGETLWTQRLFPLLISLSCLWMTFLVGKKMFHETVGLGASLLLVAQGAFLANSTFQLPEMLLTLLLLTTVYFFLSNQRWLFIVSATCMLFVKEPAVILLAILFLFHFFILLRREPLKARIKIAGIYLIPVGLNLLFYAHQYMVQGWVFFPLHTGYVTSEPQVFFNHLSRYFLYLFIYAGRNGVFFVSLALLLFILVKNRKQHFFTPEVQNGILLGMLIVGYLIFSSFNFYSNRYLICIFPAFTLLAAAVIYYAFSGYRWLYLTAIVALSVTALFFTLKDTRETDHALGYVHAVKCQLAAVRFCVEQGWQNKSINTSFLMQKNLTSHYPRYLHKNETFSNVNKHPPETAGIIIVTSNERLLHNHPRLQKMELVKQFEIEKSWCRIYRQQ